MPWAHELVRNKIWEKTLLIYLLQYQRDNFFFENTGELRFVVLEKKMVPIHPTYLIWGPNMRGGLSNKIKTENLSQKINMTRPKLQRKLDSTTKL